MKFIAAALLSVFFLLGNFYYAFDDYNYHLKKAAIADIAFFEGVVIDEPQRRVDRQVAHIKLAEGERILVHMNPYPELSYGDIIKISGKMVSPPDDSYGNYLAKERIHGTIFYPEIKITGKNSNPFFRALYSFRSGVKSSIGLLFTQRQSAFLGGIMFGDRDEFSREFLDKLSFSGTMHLTALSGLHMTMVVFAAIVVFLEIFRHKRRPAFWATFVTVALFVAMTGFKVSAIRASAMAFIVGLAEQTSRLYNPRNAIILAALVITMINPKAPVFDLGFQLSFVATASIIYLAPVFKRFSFFKKEDSYLGWREVLVITTAAQLGVAPFTMAYFANFSFSAFPANIAILVIMPILMLFGFAVAFASFVFWPLAVILSKQTAFLLDYSIAAVEIFYSLRVPFNPEIDIVAAVAYYAFLIYICAKWSPKAKNFFS